MIKAVSIICLIALVLTLGLILKLIFSFHDKDEALEIDFHKREKRRDP